MTSGSTRYPPTRYEEEEYELTEDGVLLEPNQIPPTKYKDRSTINWLQEGMTERDRQQKLKSKAGVRGILAPAFEAAREWLVVILTGMGIGIAGAWLDILVKWYVVCEEVSAWLLDLL